jgi:hypothetical protein
MTLANPEGTTEVLPGLLPMYPCVHDVYKYWSHSLEVTARNIRYVQIPEYVYQQLSGYLKIFKSNNSFTCEIPLLNSVT